MDANSGEPWSEADISDLKNELDHGRTVAETASFLCRDEDEVRQKAKEFGANPSAQTPLSGRKKNRNPPPITTRASRLRSIIFILRAYHDSPAAKKKPRGEAGLRRAIEEVWQGASY